MSIFELLILALGLSMDALAIAICKGLAIRKISLKEVCVVAVWFGLFQTLMPLIGFILGSTLKLYIESIDHWIAFVLLGAIGANMIKESLSVNHTKSDSSLSFKTMLTMAVATSIDALAAGITLILPGVNIIVAVSFIGIVTFLASALGVKLGNMFGAKYKSKAEFAGGFILVALGVKILFEHLSF